MGTPKEELREAARRERDRRNTETLLDDVKGQHIPFYGDYKAWRAVRNENEKFKRFSEALDKPFPKEMEGSLDHVIRRTQDENR